MNSKQRDAINDGAHSHTLNVGHNVGKHSHTVGTIIHSAPMAANVVIGGCTFRQVNGKLEIDGEISDSARKAFNSFYDNYVNSGELYKAREEIRQLTSANQALVLEQRRGLRTIMGEVLIKLFKLKPSNTSLSQAEGVKLCAKQIDDYASRTLKIIPKARHTFLVCHTIGDGMVFARVGVSQAGALILQSYETQPLKALNVTADDFIEWARGEGGYMVVCAEGVGHHLADLLQERTNRPVRSIRLSTVADSSEYANAKAQAYGLISGLMKIDACYFQTTEQLESVKAYFAGDAVMEHTNGKIRYQKAHLPHLTVLALAALAYYHRD